MTAKTGLSKLTSRPHVSNTIVLALCASSGDEIVSRDDASRFMMYTICRGVGGVAARSRA